MGLNSPQSNREEALKLGTQPLLIPWGFPRTAVQATKASTVASGLAEPTLLGS